MQEIRKIRTRAVNISMFERLKKKIFNAYGRDQLNKFHVLATQYVLRLYRQTNRNFEKTYGFKRAIESDEGRLPPFRSISKGKEQQQPDGKQAIGNSGNDEDDGWDWRGLPKIWPILYLIEWFGTVMLVIIAVKSCLLYIFQFNDYLILAKPAHCYLIGRLSMLEHLDLYTNLVGALFNLAWRFVQNCTNRPHSLAMHFFMLISDHDLEKCMKLYDKLKMHEQVKTYESAGFPRCLVLAHEAGVGTQSISYSSHYRRRMDSITQASGATGFRVGARFRVSLPTMIASSCETDKDGGSGQEERQMFIRSTPNEPHYHLNSCRERFFKRLLCYKVTNDTEQTGRGGTVPTYYKLRPNRTPEAKRKLEHETVKLAVPIVALFVGLSVLLNWTNFLNVSSDKRYLRVYPGCDEHLEQLNRDGKLTDWSRTLSKHHTLTIMADTLQTTLMGLVCGYAAFWCWPTLYLLNYDLLLYWRELGKKLELLYALARSRYSGYDVSRRTYLTAANVQWARTEIGATTTTTTTTTMQQSSLHQARAFYVDPRRLDASIYELQAQFSDFFTRIDEVDSLFSDAITISIAIWLVFFLLFALKTVNYYRQAASIDLFLVLGIGLILLSLIIMTVFSLTLVQLHSESSKVYLIVCALMAHDQGRHKHGFLKLMEYFTHRKRTAYTILQHYPLTRAKLLSIFSFSLSCFIIVDGFLRTR